VFVPTQEFERLWLLGLSGLLKHAHIVITKPRYGSALVVSISFSTHPDE
jgi:hypothetical protein